jgi:SAM-dependent methyltransferase
MAREVLCAAERERSMSSPTIVAGIELQYGCDRAALPAELAARFVELECDAQAQRFIEQALAAPHGWLATAVFRGLRRALSDYDAYGLLGMYSMHLLSTPQLETLLGGAAPASQRPRSVLDVGAGNGQVTAQAAPLFDAVSATEASAVMRRRLRARGFAVLERDLAQQPLPDGETFDAVLCLNVLDRCARPRTLLRHLRAGLAPDGRLLLSVPLPLSPHVQVGGRTTDPDEPLPARVVGWEAGVASLASKLLVPAGLRVERLSRAPYLCRGDARQQLYALDAALFVCSAQRER